MSAEPKATPRRELLVDRKMQLSVVLSMVGVLFALTAVYVVAVVSNTSAESGPDSSAIRRLAFLTTGAYFAVVLTATLIVGVKVTQKIAGPARLIEHAVRALRRGDFGARLSLRKGDHLTTLAAEVEALRDQIKVMEGHRRDLDTDLVALLEKGEHDAARERLAARMCLGLDADTGPAPEPDTESRGERAA